jgi:hypothetical protein
LRIDRIVDATSAALDQMMARISRDQQFNSPEFQGLQRELLDGGVRFWDQLIATDLDNTGKPGPLHRAYRVERALCLARLGNHKLAFSEARALSAETDKTEVDRWARDLARVCSLCASATIDEPSLANLYIEEGIEYLQRAARSAKGPALSENDPDLEGLRSHPSFPSILAQWTENWTQEKALRRID